MELDASFVCPSCSQRIQVAAEYDEDESRWKFDIRAVEESKAEGFVERRTELGEDKPDWREPEEEEESEGEETELEDESKWEKSEEEGPMKELG